MLPKEVIEDEAAEKEDEEKEVDDPESVENEEPKEKKPKEKKVKPRKFKLLEAHRMRQIIENVYSQMDIVLLEAYCKQKGEKVFNTQFRGLTKPQLSDLALLKDYQKYLNGEIKQTDISTLTSQANKFYYHGHYDILNNCLIVTNVYYKGLIFYVYASSLVWGQFYDGDGVSW